jgi:pre-mRNA-splicing factor CDC5/CEF1
VNFDLMLAQASSITDPIKAALAREMAILIANDAVENPAPNSSYQGARQSVEQFDDGALALARLQIVQEASLENAAFSAESFQTAWEECHPSSLLPRLVGHVNDAEEIEQKLLVEEFDVSRSICLFWVRTDHISKSRKP